MNSTPSRVLAEHGPATRDLNSTEQLQPLSAYRKTLINQKVGLHLLFSGRLMLVHDRITRRVNWARLVLTAQGKPQAIVTRRCDRCSAT